MFLQADARHIPLADESVHMVCTSPPYWGLRDYSVNGQLGLERTPEEYVATMVEVFREVKRVLRSDATLWLNMGDGFSSGDRATFRSSASDNKGQQVQDNMPRPKTPPGLKPKDLIGLPWRLAFALQADGWWLRSDIVWAKPNPMPESVTDRPTKSHEYIFLLTKSARYYYDQEAVKEESVAPDRSRGSDLKVPVGATDFLRTRSGLHDANGKVYPSRNLRSVWTFATQPYPEAHFATFPEELAKRCILAGTSARGCCPVCGAPWEREVENGDFTRTGGHKGNSRGSRNPQFTSGMVPGFYDKKTIGWHPTCDCQPDSQSFRDTYRLPPCIVLDPFAGSGTTVAVAESLGRRGVGLELSSPYICLAMKRLRSTPLGLQL